jgi:transcription antitermination factor NusG
MNNTPENNNGNHVVRWFPLRIFYSSAKRQLELKEELDKESVVEETYVPLELIDAETNRFAPVLLNYIFVRITLDNLKELKQLPKFNLLRYVMQFERDTRGNRIPRIASVTDREMNNFQQVINSLNEQVEFIQNNDFAMRPGQKVKITEGTFKGVEGTLKSIKKHLCVVVALSGIIALAITGIHRKHLEPVD